MRAQDKYFHKTLVKTNLLNANLYFVNISLPYLLIKISKEYYHD